MNKFGIMLSISLAFATCKKESHPDWEFFWSGYLQNYGSLTFKHHKEYSDNGAQYSINFMEGNRLVYVETHCLTPRNNLRKDHLKQIILEFPDTTGITEFNYVDGEIYDQLKTFISHRFNSFKDGYYLIKKGYISGRKVNGEWIIDFDVTYGGKDRDKFRLVSNADY